MNIILLFCLQKMTDLKKTHFFNKIEVNKRVNCFLFFFCINDPIQLFKRPSMLRFCIRSPDICSPQQLRCAPCVLLFACVRVPPSLTSVLPRVHAEFSRLYAALLMCVSGGSGISPAWSLPKSHLQTRKVMTPRRNN